MSKLAKIGTVIDGRSVAATWRRQRSRHVLQQPRFQHQNSVGHQTASCTRPLKQIANTMGRRIAKRVIAPIKDKFVANSESIDVCTNRRKPRRYGTVVPGDDEKVKVLRLDGAPLEFDYPPMAATLIMENPNHVIVLCCTLRTRWGKSKDRSNVTIVSGIQELEAGRKYYLLPVPPSLRKVESTSKDGQAPERTMCSKVGLKRLPREAAPSVLQVGRGRRKKIMLSAITQGEVETILESAAGGKSSEMPQIDSYSKFSAWTPALGSIPESPQPKQCPLSRTADRDSELLAYVRASIDSELELR